MASTCVDLGFAEECDDSWRLLSHYFPSKLGGSPAWLQLKHIPSYENLKCCQCSRVCKFLMQVYSPGAGEAETETHSQSVSLSEHCTTTSTTATKSNNNNTHTDTDGGVALGDLEVRSGYSPSNFETVGGSAFPSSEIETQTQTETTSLKPNGTRDEIGPCTQKVINQTQAGNFTASQDEREPQTKTGVEFSLSLSNSQIKLPILNHSHNDKPNSNVNLINTDNSQTYHRSLFIFVCENESCTKPSIKCFRSQLPRKNSIYSFNPPNEHFFDESQPYPQASDYGKLCHVCHCSATKSCSRCKKYTYCCKEHQVLHWKACHKIECADSQNSAPEVNPTKIGEKSCKRTELDYFFDEYEIVVEAETISKPKSKSEKETLQEFESYIRNNKPDKELSAQATKSDWDAAEEVKIADRAFMKFRERIADNPDQIIRYNRGGKPLLVSDDSTVPQDIPNCESCGAARQFEFQIMSQTLSYLHMTNVKDGLDWGTLLVYTCEKSCEIEGYAAEFVWKQDFSSKDLVEKA